MTHLPHHGFENVGPNFNEAKLLEFQKKTWAVLDWVAARIKPGMTEQNGLEILNSHLKELGDIKYWHPPQIRFGRNTTKAFGKPPFPDIALAENDIFFFDIGPLFEGYEGDAGKTYTIGHDPELSAIAEGSEKLFRMVQTEWQKSKKTGKELYDYAQVEAENLGYTLSLGGASGHRIADFPHAVHYRGKLHTFSKIPSANRWILEIHLLHKSREIGSFFEDIL